MGAFTSFVFLLMLISFGDSVYGSEDHQQQTPRNPNRGTRQRRTPDSDIPRRSSNPITPRSNRNPPNPGQDGQQDVGRSTSVQVGVPESPISTFRHRRPTQGGREGLHPLPRTSHQRTRLSPLQTQSASVHEQQAHALRNVAIAERGDRERVEENTSNQREASSSGSTGGPIPRLRPLRLASHGGREEQSAAPHNAVVAEHGGLYRPDPGDLMELTLQMRDMGILSSNPEENVALYRRLTARGPPHEPLPRPIIRSHEEIASTRLPDTEAEILGPQAGVVRRGIEWLYSQMHHFNIGSLSYYTERQGGPPFDIHRDASEAGGGPRARIARVEVLEEVEFLPLGLIVEYRNMRLIVSYDYRNRRKTLRPLEDNERRILARIIRRRPTRPSQYFINPIFYEIGDRLLGPAQPPRIGVEQYGECFAAGIMSNIISYERGVFGFPMKPKDNFLLFRSTGRYITSLRDFEFDHIATYTDNMWVYVTLLPTNQEKANERWLLERYGQRGLYRNNFD